MRVGRSRSGAAWVASALVHGLIAALVLRAGERAALRAPAPDAVELEFEVAQEAPMEEVPAEATAPSPPQRRVERRSSGADPSPSPSPRFAGRGDMNVEIPSLPAPSPQADEGEGAERPVDLSLGALPDEFKKRFAGAPAPEETLRARPRRFDVDELRAEVERQQDAVANVDKGRADPVLYDYLRGAKSRFMDQAELLADDLTIGPGDAVRAWGRGFLRTVEEVNRGTYSTEARRADAADARNEKHPGADALGAYGHARRSAEAGAEQRRAEVCVSVAAGREPAVALRRSSGNAALDRLSLESFTKAVAARPVPDDARRGLACYELRISAYRMPPLPSISCGVGRAGLTCVWPFKKVTNVRGRLLSVEYPQADGGGPRAGPSLLRKPR